MLRLSLAAFASIGFLSLGLSAQSPSSARTLVTQAIDDNKTVILPGNTRPEATAANDRGRVADSRQFEHMLLMLKRPAEREAEMGQFAAGLTDANSANYHHWLTAKQIGRQFGPSKADIAMVEAWLKSKGFSVNGVSPTEDLIDFSGSARSVREAFHTEIHNLNVRGESHIANTSDPAIPAALAEIVKGPVSFNNFRPHPMYKNLRPNVSTAPDYTSTGGRYLVAPPDLSTIYSLNPLFSSGVSGQGQTIVVVEDTNLASSADWLAFRKRFALTKAYPYATLAQVHPQGGSGGPCSDPGVNGDDVEADLDVQWASAAAPNAHIVLAACDNTDFNFGGFVALENLLTGSAPSPSIVSVSYGAGESELGSGFNAYVNLLYEIGAIEGVSIYVSAGDSGSDGNNGDRSADLATHGINVSGFASTPFNVAVGGTDFSDSYFGTTTTYWNPANAPNGGSAKSYVPEIPWNGSCASTLIATVLGFSKTYGSDGACSDATVLSDGLVNVIGGGGGPSGCAFGTPNVYGAASSGGCQGYQKPAWQSAFGVPNDGVRDLPDVSLFSASGTWGHYYLFCYSDAAFGGVPCNQGLFGAGGTSFASPILAGFQALVNQYTGSVWGNPNPVLYNLGRSEYGSSGNASCDSTLAAAASPSCIFHDVTLGENTVACRPGSYDCFAPSGSYGVLSTSTSSYQPAFAATPGWDFATGLGTVNAYNLVTNWLSGSVAAAP